MYQQPTLLFQYVPTTLVTEIKETYFEIYTKQVSCPLAFLLSLYVVGPICNNFEKNRAFYDKSMKLGTWLVDNKTKKLRVSATPKMSSNGSHLVFPKWPPFSTYSF